MKNSFEILFNSEYNDTNVKDEYSEKDKTDSDLKIFDLLTAIREKDEDFFLKISDNEFEREKKLLNCIYPLLRWFSSVGINKIDWEEAKKQGRKKGDKKGPWPSNLYDSSNTYLSLLVSNEINQYFWELTKKTKSGRSNVFLIFLMMIYFSPDLKKEESFNWIKKPNNGKIKEKIDELLLKINPNLNKMELEILRKKYKNKEGIRKLIQYLGLNNVNENDYI